MVDGEAVCECQEGFANGDEDPLSCEPAMVKPIIHLYPTERTEVTVRFARGPEGLLTHTYPEYGPEGWRVIADPDGALTDPSTGLEYYALYWEGRDCPGWSGLPYTLKAGERKEVACFVDLDQTIAEVLKAHGLKKKGKHVEYILQCDVGVKGSLVDDKTKVQVNVVDGKSD